MRYLVRVLIALDQLLSTLACGFPDETLSARAWRERRRRPWGVVRAAIDLLFFWQPDHCRRSYLRELERGQLPEIYRSGR